MHSIDYKKYTIHHNGDYSGEVEIMIPIYHPNYVYNTRAPEFYSNQAQRVSQLIHGPDDLAPDYWEVEIPFELMEYMVAQKLRMEIISQLEDMDEKDILRLASERLYERNRT